MIKIEINDREVRQAMNRLIAAGGNLKPALAEIGEQLVRSTKLRFESQTDPDGNRWAPNKESTLLAYLDNKAGKNTTRKDEKFKNKFYNQKRDKGKLNAKGARALIAKKVLAGGSNNLADQFNRADGSNCRVSNSTVEVGSTMAYAAVQQFGAKQGAFGKNKKGRPIPWGDIPARPFLGLSAKDKQDVLAILNEHLAKAMGGRS